MTSVNDFMKWICVANSIAEELTGSAEMPGGVGCHGDEVGYTTGAGQ